MSLEPGIYKATVRGVPDTTVMLDAVGFASTMTEVAGSAAHTRNDITDARPLIVLDLTVFPSGLVSDLRWAEGIADMAGDGKAFRVLAEQIEAQSKPPRIPEPGLWGVVVASCDHQDDRGSWINDGLGWARVGAEVIRTHNHDGWSDLIDPTLVRPGIEASS